MLGLAVEWGELDRVPVKWLKVPEAEFDFLDFEEAERLLAAVEEGEWRTMVLLAIKTGLRQGEILALRLDGRGSRGRAPGGQAVSHAGDRDHAEDGRSRRIPLAPSVLTALKRHRHIRGKLVFCAADGRTLTKNECKHPLW